MAKPLIWMLCCVLLAMPLAAQLSRASVAEIPFGFYVSDKWMPAGEYRFELQTDRVFVGPSDKGPQAVAMVYGGTKRRQDAEPLVVFTKYSEARIFLSRIAHPAMTSTAELTKSKRERELVSSRVVAQKPPESITLVAKLVR
jgi:hypothetical protein